MLAYILQYPTLVDIIRQFPLLFALMTANIALGTYFNTGVVGNAFHFKILFQGIKKAFIIALGFGTLAMGFDTLGTEGIDISPSVMIHAAQIMYCGKIIAHLYKILDIQKFVTSKNVTLHTENGE